jgi:hypothetical protein
MVSLLVGDFVSVKEQGGMPLPQEKLVFIPQPTDINSKIYFLSGIAGSVRRMICEKVWDSLQKRCRDETICRLSSGYFHKFRHVRKLSGKATPECRDSLHPCSSTVLEKIVIEKTGLLPLGRRPGWGIRMGLRESSL